MADNAKTVEELESERIEARKARFAQNPDSFIEVSDIIIAAIRTPGVGLEVSVYVAPSKRSEYDIALTEINLRTLSTLMAMDRAQALKQQPKIAIPGKRVFGAFGGRH